MPVTHPRAARASLPRRLAALALTLALPGSPPVLAAAPARYDPAVFFSGRTQGIGQLKVIFRKAVPVRVEGTGHVEDGVLVLSQVIHEDRKPARTRLWRIREISPGRYTGTSSDAKGPVTGDVTGNRLHLAFTANDGMTHEQTLTFAADGRSAHNVLKVRKVGLVVARLEETIRKLD